LGRRGDGRRLRAPGRHREGLRQGRQGRPHRGGDKVDLTAVGLDGFGDYGDKGPDGGEFSIWYLGDDSYVIWFHDDMPRDIQFEGVRLTTADVIW
jgi:hypothetical protein